MCGGFLEDVSKQLSSPIDLTRPAIKNEDGTFSTERTITISQDGKWINIPTIIDGIPYSDLDAISYAQRTGENFGVFDTLEEATKEAKMRSEEIGKLRGF